MQYQCRFHLYTRAQLVIILTGNVVVVEIDYLFMACFFQESLSSLLSSFALAGEESLFLQKFILSVVDPQSKPTQTLQAFVNSLSGYFKVIQSSKTKSMNNLAFVFCCWEILVKHLWLFKKYWYYFRQVWKNFT